MGQVVQGDPERPGALTTQPTEMSRVVDPEDGVSAPVALALMGVMCAVVLGFSQLLGTVDLAQVGWTDVGYGVAALAGVGGIGALRMLAKTTDRLDACEEAGPGVQLVSPTESRFGLGPGMRQAWGATKIGVLLAGAIALLGWGDDSAYWALIACGFVLGVTVQIVVRDALILKHERAEGVWVLRPDDADGWYEESTGKELASTDPGPLFQQRAGSL